MENPTLWRLGTVDSVMSGFPGRGWRALPVRSRGMGRPVLNSYLIEAYVPNLDQESALAIAATLEDAAARLTDLHARVEWRLAIAIHAEETYLVLVAAPNEDLARRWSEAASLRVDHLIEVTQITRASGRCRRSTALLTPRRPGR
jgi:hypothetical protein